MDISRQGVDCVTSHHHESKHVGSGHQEVAHHESFYHAVVTKPAPAFSAPAVMPDGSIKDVSLEEFCGKKYVLLYFYPLDFTFVCPSGKHCPFVE